jgi:Protein of unknown function (DUF3667)
VSHIPQRKEKDCLNCGTIVQGHYCQNCGQENVVPHETFWHMVKHFLYDITHFDSKFFDSMRYLLLKPGFLPGQYIKGKRASYLNPVKKYVFTSAIFFLLFFGVFLKKDSITINDNNPVSSEKRMEEIKESEAELKKNPDNAKMKEYITLLKDTSQALTSDDLARFRGDFIIIKLSGRQYKDLAEYDSVQKALPAGERDGWVRSKIQRNNLKIRKKYQNDPGSTISKMINIFLHKLPYLLFVSLPLFALILKLLYIRRKNFYYADHGIFSIYHYIFTFLLLLIVFAFDKLNTATGWEFLDFATGLTFMSGGIYLYTSMKRFYGQGHGKTFLKFVALNILGVIMLLFLLTVFFFLSVFEI